METARVKMIDILAPTVNADDRDALSDRAARVGRGPYRWSSSRAGQRSTSRLGHATAATTPVPTEGGAGIGDRDYGPPDRPAILAKAGFELLAPYRLKATNPAPEHSRLQTHFRRAIETVIGQLAERFNAKNSN